MRPPRKILKHFLQSAYRISPKLGMALLKMGMAIKIHSIWYGFTLRYLAIVAKRDKPSFEALFLQQIRNGRFNIFVTMVHFHDQFIDILERHDLFPKVQEEVLSLYYDSPSLRHLLVHFFIRAKKYDFVKKLIFQIDLCGVVEIEKIADRKTEISMGGEKYIFGFPELVNAVKNSEIHELKTLPEVIWTVKDVSVIGAMSLIKNNNIVIYDPSSHPDFGFIAGTSNFITGSTKGSDRVLVEHNPQNRKFLKQGILLSGRCTTNYFHWMIEYLPRMKLLEQMDLKGDFHLIVKDEMPVQHLEVLQMINRSGFPIYRHRDHETLIVDELIIPSMQTFIPDRYDIPFWKSSLLSSDHFHFVRNRILESEAIKEQVYQGPKRVYLSRRSNLARQIINRKGVEKCFLDNGYTIVFPEMMSFSEQVAMFSNVTHIAGPGGAANTNIMFCRTGTQVLSLVASVNREFCLHSNIASMVGAKFSYFLGFNNSIDEFYGDLAEKYHDEIEIDVSALDEYLKKSL